MTDNIFNNSKIPWCIDLDGTLIREDVTQLAFWGLVKRVQFIPLMKALALFVVSYAHAKHYVESAFAVDVNRLTYNQKLLGYIRAHKKRGGLVYLATAADHGVAQRVADHLALFDGVIASDGKVNRRAEKKAETLNALFGESCYIYAGNSRDDLKVWPSTCAMIVVNAPRFVLHNARTLGKRTLVIDSWDCFADKTDT